jgi:hypothetical protein
MTRQHLLRQGAPRLAPSGGGARARASLTGAASRCAKAAPRCVKVRDWNQSATSNRVEFTAHDWRRVRIVSAYFAKRYGNTLGLKCTRIRIVEHEKRP